MNSLDEILMDGVNARVAQRKSEARGWRLSSWRQEVKSLVWYLAGMGVLMLCRPIIEDSFGLDLRLVVAAVTFAWVVFVRFNAQEKTILQLEERLKILEEGNTPNQSANPPAPSGRGSS